MEQINLKYPNKRTQIVCTIGPASWEADTIKRMIENGMNVARINAAFADQSELERVENLIRQFSSDVALMLDVKGPEVRLNKFESSIPLTQGMTIEIGSSEEFKIFPANSPELYTKLSPGQEIVVGDGDVKLKVTEIKEKSFVVEVVYGTELKPGKALTVPGVVLNEALITDRERELIEFIKQRDWQYVSASLIRTAQDVQYFKDLPLGDKLKLIAKIENDEGVENIDEILKVVDGIMIARGGLGVQMGIEQVPIAERILLKKCKEVGKYVIVGTQMLESMTANIVPTRAEANDVAMAILAGADAIMLSAETTTGKYPAEAVEFMSKVEMALHKAGMLE